MKYEGNHILTALLYWTQKKKELPIYHILTTPTKRYRSENGEEEFHMSHILEHKLYAQEQWFARIWCTYLVIVFIFL